MTVKNSLNIKTEDNALLTDLYQLTMSACYVGEGIANKTACFELFVRNFPSTDFGYLVAMGLEQVINYLQNFSFSSEQIDYLQNTGIFNHAPPEFWSLLADTKFTGDLWAVPEGTIIFPHEPFLRIEAPLWQAQIVETYLLNTINYQTLIATKASRIRQVAGEEALILEFGTRRAFSPQASVWAARAAIAGGLDTTSNVLAGMKLGVKPAGTMAHALVMAIKALAGSEEDAFIAFNRYFPQSTLLIDTYDTIKAAENLEQLITKNQVNIWGVRLDSGDLVSLAYQVKEILPEIKIFVSGDLDEFAIAELKQQQAPINGYGIGTKLVTGNPVNGVYKLVEIDGIPTMKKSAQKMTYPGKKQIFRGSDQDRLGLSTETAKLGEKPLLELVIQQGQRLTSPENLGDIRQRVGENLNQLSATIRQVNQPAIYPVQISAELDLLTDKIKENDEEKTGSSKLLN